jgi:hypothetical protein
MDFNFKFEDVALLPLPAIPSALSARAAHEAITGANLMHAA